MREFEYKIKGSDYFFHCEIVTHINDATPCVSITGISYLLSEFNKHGTVTIPGKIDGYEVGHIARSAFLADRYIKKIILPDSIKVIHDYAFKDSNIKSIHLGNGIEKIGDCAFQDCTHLVDINLPEGLKHISIAAFKECVSLPSIVFPDSLETLGGSAFDNCTSLESLHIGASLSRIGSLATSDFAYHCDALKNVTISPANENFKIEKGIMYNVKNGMLVKVFNNMLKRDSVTIPLWITNVATCSFDSVYLKNLTIKHNFIPNISMAHIRNVDNVRCVPGSFIDNYFKVEKIKRTPINENKLGKFLDNLNIDTTVKEQGDDNL